MTKTLADAIFLCILDNARNIIFVLCLCYKQIHCVKSQSHTLTVYITMHCISISIQIPNEELN